VSSASVFAKLREIGTPTVPTREAAAALRVSTSSASRALKTLAERRLAHQIRHGLWTLADRPADPRLLAGEITRPHPAYVSFASALAAYGVIDQIPREISLASTGRPKRVKTDLFGGYDLKDGVAIATPEKALFDFVYVSQASGRNRQRLPELDLPRSFSRSEVQRWIKRISSP
jgi:predicted transcriptional regulator of viral defense system